jgi:glutamate racemase
VLRELRRVLPWADFVYVADSRHVPYGTKPASFVEDRAVAIARYLVEVHHADAIVVACNTATTHGVERLRALYPSIPIVGMEPALKPAAAATRSRVVGVLATGSTIESKRFARLKEHTSDGIEVVTQPCPGLVERIEAGDLSGPATVDLLKKYITPLLARGADTIVLGCTHYPLLRSTLQTVVGPAVTLIDTAAAVARQTIKVLGDRGHSAATRQGTVTWVTSGNPVEIREVLQRLWSEPIDDVAGLPDEAAA